MAKGSPAQSPWDRIEIIQGDITKFRGDAVINAANCSLLGGGGVDGAIHRAAGRQLLEECRTLGGCPTGDARITKGYDLPCRFVIHTVGPVYDDGRRGEPKLLRACYENSLKLAAKNGIRTVAFPAISCGVYGYPIEDAARIALPAAAEFLRKHAEIDKVTFVLFGASDLAVYRRVADELRGE
jgi:O-acetyl-ADP-ribose deacetylase (regulator of RNase III)